MGCCFAASWLRLHFSELIWLHRSQKQLHFKLLRDLSPRPILNYPGSNTGWIVASKCLWITGEIKGLCDMVLGLKGCFPTNKLNGAKEHSQAPDLSCLWCCIAGMVLLASLPKRCRTPFWLVWIPQQYVYLVIFHVKYFVLPDHDFLQNYFIR